MTAYYNDNDKKVCAWLRELIKRDLISPGDVDDRPIQEIQPNDVKQYTQCHFFAGVGGWSYALRLAGWPDDRPVWSGSCPCQPYSTAGKQKGNADERNLWPDFYRLIRECRPDTIFGEQVEGAIKHGWLDGVQTDLEAEGYAVGHCVLGAHSVGSPHKRQRLYWVADANSQRQSLGTRQRGDDETSQRPATGQAIEQDGPDRMANTKPQRRRGWGDGDTTGDDGALQAEGRGVSCAVGNTQSDGRDAWRPKPSGRIGTDQASWQDYRIIECSDGKYRRIPKTSAKSIFQFTSDGFSAIMGDSWNRFIRSIEERIISYASQANTRPQKVLRKMWSAYAQETIWKNAGGYVSVQEPEILLLAMCELTRTMGTFINGSPQVFCEIQAETMRILWKYEEFACPSHKQGLEGPSCRKSKNALHKMSSVQSTQKEVEVMRYMREAVKTKEDVSETLSTVEEVWRCFVDKEKKSGNIERIRDGARIIKSMGGFPLSESFRAKNILLKGAGNAIVPQVAAEFIKAFCEVNP